MTSENAGGLAQTETLTYDATGNTKTRVGGEVGEQEITWDAEGHQKSVKDEETEDLTSYIYDADGNRLIKKDPTVDSTTLYVGSSEYTVKAGTKSLIRNYSVGDEPVATRTAAGLTVVIADRNNSGQLAIEGATLAVQQRRFTPFGEDLEESEAVWPNDHGYLDKTKDASTGTTHLGAREYDPKLGRFLSVDPIMRPDDPQQLNGYAYANNTPITSSDPSGLDPPCDRCVNEGFYGGGGSAGKHPGENAGWDKNYVPYSGPNPDWREELTPETPPAVRLRLLKEAQKRAELNPRYTAGGDLIYRRPW